MANGILFLYMDGVPIEEGRDEVLKFCSGHESLIVDKIERYITSYTELESTSACLHQEPYHSFKFRKLINELRALGDVDAY